MHRVDSIPELLREKEILCREDGVKRVEGQNALNVLVGIPSRYRSAPDEKAKYLENAKDILNELEFFDDATLLPEIDNQAIFQLRLGSKGP